ncbi:MAG: RNA polymerase sigma factor [Candidatus Cyclobacteriaceae bacterium M2_1C_046]
MTEERLMTAVKNGDLDQAKGLFEIYHRQLYGFFIKMTRDEDLAKDLVQNVFYRMLKYRNTYNENNPFKAWIYRIARNSFSDHLRQNKMVKSDFEDVEKKAGLDDGVDKNWEDDERNEQLHKSLAMLPEDDRQLLVMSKFQHMKYEEIARIMDYTVPNVKVKIHRAIKKLRDNFYELEKI